MNNIDFFKNIDQLPQPDKVALGKAAGKLLREASGSASIAFTKCIPTEGDYPSQDLEDRYFSAACLYCIWPSFALRKKMEKVLWAMSHDLHDENVVKRLEHDLPIIFDYKWDGDNILPQKLSRLFKLIKDSGYAVDGPTLLADLLEWGEPHQTVTLRWIKSMYRQPQ